MEAHLTNAFDILYIAIGSIGVAIIAWGVAEIAILASIVVIRTVISYFLEKEISIFNTIDK